MRVWDTRTPMVQRTYESRAAVNSVVLHPNQGELISGERGRGKQSTRGEEEDGENKKAGTRRRGGKEGRHPSKGSSYRVVGWAGAGPGTRPRVYIG